MATNHSKNVPTWAVVGVLSVCGMVVAIQQTMVIPLLPEFPAIFGRSGDDTSWLVTVTLLTAAVATPIVSKLADMFGKRLMLLVCMFAMTTGSVLAAAVPVFPAVITGRGLQGFATALIPIGISIMRDELPPKRVASAVALMSATLGTGAALGLPLSGFISVHWGWQAIFLVSAVIGAVLITGVLLLVSESAVRTKGRFDYVGAVALSVALSALLLAITKGGAWGWTSEAVVGLFVLSVVILVLWVPFELKIGYPLVDLRTSGRRPVLLTNAASVLAGFSMYANMLVTAQQLQIPQATGYGLGLSVSAAGLAMIPIGLAMVVFAPVSGRMINRMGGRLTLITGAVVMGVTYIARVYSPSTLTAVIIGSTLVGVGTAIAYASMPTIIMASVPLTETASANGVNALLRGVGTSTSSAAVAAVLGSVTMQVGGTSMPSYSSFQEVFLMAGVAAIAAGAVAWFIPARNKLSDVTSIASAGGTRSEILIRGRVLLATGAPAFPSVVSVLTTEGAQVDWGRGDNDGSFSVVLPRLGRYLVLANAQGWGPRAQVMEFDGPTDHIHIALDDVLTLSGVIRKGGRPIADALVALTQAGGGLVQSLVSDQDGRYCIPLPPAGRYIMTVLEPGSVQAHAIRLVLDVMSVVVDVDVPPSSRCPG